MAELRHVKGLRELGLAMQALGKDMAGKVARQATAAGAGVSRKAIKARAPVDSGNLRAAIVMKRVKGSHLTEEYVVAVRKGKTRDAKAGKRGEGRQGKDAYYAGFQEFGTVKAPAQPFVRPGFEESTQQATEAIAKRLKQRIDKVSAK